MSLPFHGDFHGDCHHEKIIFHQDRGSQYTGTSYITAVLNAGGHLSYSKKGEPGDNAVNEAFFSRLKEEWRDVFFGAKTFEELEATCLCRRQTGLLVRCTCLQQAGADR